MNKLFLNISSRRGMFVREVNLFILISTMSPYTNIQEYQQYARCPYRLFFLLKVRILKYWLFVNYLIMSKKEKVISFAENSSTRKVILNGQTQTDNSQPTTHNYPKFPIFAPCPT